MPAGQVLTRLQRQRADKRKINSSLSSSIPPPPSKKLKGSAYCQSENSSIDLDSVTASTSSSYGCEIITNNNSTVDEAYSGTCLNSVPSLGSLAATSTGSSSSSGNCDTSSSTSSSTTTEEEVLSFGNKPFESNNPHQYFSSAVDSLKRLPLQFSKQNFTNVSYSFQIL
uniref:Uncharacterized protein n=1 Tax=Panagrolaimus sp. ES5 TaxID=591445 RepID=A0AC34EZR3_9BILA